MSNLRAQLLKTSGLVARLHATGMLTASMNANPSTAESGRLRSSSLIAAHTTRTEVATGGVSSTEASAEAVYTVPARVIAQR